MTVQQGARADAALDALEQLLRDDGCFICRHRVEAARFSPQASLVRLCPRHKVVQPGPEDSGRPPFLDVAAFDPCCPICRRERHADIQAVAAFLEGLANGTLRSAWEKSDGLCPSHFRLAWQRGGGLRELLMAVHGHRLARAATTAVPQPTTGLLGPESGR